MGQLLAVFLGLFWLFLALIFRLLVFTFKNQKRRGWNAKKRVKPGNKIGGTRADFVIYRAPFIALRAKAN